MHFVRQVCRSLAEAHAVGLVHRDVKPANIYVCRMGLEYDFAKVLDFGLVKHEDRSRGGDADGGARGRSARRPTWRPKSSSASTTRIAARTSTLSAAWPITC